MTDRDWNPRYGHYARVHGCTPEEMYARDARTWPGGRMAGYIIWIRQMLRRWAEQSDRLMRDGHYGEPRPRPMDTEDHDAFDAWLAALPPNFDNTSWPAGELGFVTHGEMGRIKVRVRGTHASGLYAWETLDGMTMYVCGPEEIELITGRQGTLL